MIGVAMIVIGYAVFYWGLHHFSGVDCPEGGTKCRHSLVTLLALDRFGIAHGDKIVQYGP
jgi:hypothetical protein